MKGEIGFKEKEEQYCRGKNDDSGHDFVRDVLGNVGVYGVYGFEQEVGEFTLANAEVVYVHDPGEGELVDEHEYDVISGKVGRRIGSHATPTCMGDCRPYGEVDDGFEYATDHPYRHGGAILKLVEQ